MKLSDVIALIGAGYSKEEIAAFEQMDANGAPEQPAKPAEQPVKPAEQPAKPTEQPAKPVDNSNAEMLAALKELKEAVQASNRRQSEQPETGAKSIAEAADKALLEVYNL